MTLDGCWVGPRLVVWDSILQPSGSQPNAPPLSLQHHRLIDELTWVETNMYMNWSWTSWQSHTTTKGLILVCLLENSSTKNQPIKTVIIKKATDDLLPSWWFSVDSVKELRPELAKHWLEGPTQKPNGQQCSPGLVVPGGGHLGLQGQLLSTDRQTDKKPTKALQSETDEGVWSMNRLWQDADTWRRCESEASAAGAGSGTDAGAGYSPVSNLTSSDNSPGRHCS